MKMAKKFSLKAGFARNLAGQLEELQKLIFKGESDGLEFKKTTGQRSQAAKTVCAFLNSLGGSVVFGVTDKGSLSSQQANTKTLEVVAKLKVLSIFGFF